MSSETTDDQRSVIEAAIPHRDPFLFVDEVLERTDTSLTARWTVPKDAAWFAGHFPGQPVLPGVLICEHVFQTAALLISHALGGFSPEDGIPVLTKIDVARFRRMVRPGETLATRVQVEERVGPAWYCKGRTSCGDETVLKLGFVLTATGAAKRVGV